MNETTVSLLVFNFEDMSDISQHIKHEPSEKYLKGEYRVVGEGERAVKILNKENVWIYESTSMIDKKREFDDHLDCIVQFIKENRVGIASLPDYCEKQLTIVKYSSDHNPGFQLNAKVIQLLGSLDISMDVDLYYM
jgi:hypothetical protein